MIYCLLPACFNPTNYYAQVDNVVYLQRAHLTNIPCKRYKTIISSNTPKEGGKEAENIEDVLGSQS